MNDNKAFCILPFIHVQVRQNGEVFPCCRAQNNFSYGSTYKNTLEEIWNSDEIKRVRSEMINGKAQSFCSDCHKTEMLGTESYRQILNKEFQLEFSRIKQTNQSGLLENNQIIYLDLRFSNICNFKCRTCSPESSNNWFEDYKTVHPDWISDKKTYKLINDSKTILTDIENQIPYLKKIYFAGGEPLIDENHYYFLEKLISLKRTDISICYNSNISLLHFKNWKILELWSKFKNVQISASIDNIGTRLELLRKGANWEKIKTNLNLIQTSCPHVFIQIFPTISAINCFSLVELIDYFLERGYFSTQKKFEINLLSYPDYLNISILNSNEINFLEKKYDDYILSLNGKTKPELIDYLDSELKKVIKFARHQDLTHLRPAFKKYIFTLDNIRNEKTFEVYPELFQLLYEQ